MLQHLPATFSVFRVAADQRSAGSSRGHDPCPGEHDVWAFSDEHNGMEGEASPSTAPGCNLHQLVVTPAASSLRKVSFSPRQCLWQCKPDGPDLQNTTLYDTIRL